MTNDYSTELRAAQRSLAEKTKGLSPDVLRLRLLALANKPAGFGKGQIDPIERSWAQQALDTLTAQDGLARIEKQHADLKATRNPRQSEAHRLLALKALEDEHDLHKIKLINAAQQDHSAAAKASREAYAASEAKAAHVVAIRAAAEARAEATLLADHPAVADLAAAIVARKQAI